MNVAGKRQPLVCVHSGGKERRGSCAHINDCGAVISGTRARTSSKMPISNHDSRPINTFKFQVRDLRPVKEANNGSSEYGPVKVRNKSAHTCTAKGKRGLNANHAGVCICPLCKPRPPSEARSSVKTKKKGFKRARKLTTIIQGETVVKTVETITENDIEMFAREFPKLAPRHEKRTPYEDNHPIPPSVGHSNETRRMIGNEKGLSNLVEHKTSDLPQPSFAGSAFALHHIEEDRHKKIESLLEEGVDDTTMNYLEILDEYQKQRREKKILQTKAVYSNYARSFGMKIDITEGGNFMLIPKNSDKNLNRARKNQIGPHKPRAKSSQRKPDNRRGKQFYKRRAANVIKGKTTGSDKSTPEGSAVNTSEEEMQGQKANSTTATIIVENIDIKKEVASAIGIEESAVSNIEKAFTKNGKETIVEEFVAERESKFFTEDGISDSKKLHVVEVETDIKDGKIEEGRAAAKIESTASSENDLQIEKQSDEGCARTGFAYTDVDTKIPIRSKIETRDFAPKVEELSTTLLTETEEESIVVEIFSLVDPRNTGKVSIKKFLKEVQLNGMVQRLLEQRATLRPILNSLKVKQSLLEVDANNDGLVSVSELMQFANKNLNK